MEKKVNRILAVILTFGLSGLIGCSSYRIPNKAQNVEAFQAAEKSDRVAFVDQEALAAFEADTDMVYRLGDGDKLMLQVWGRPELSGKHTVGPDGKISVPLAGPMRVTTMTREEAAATIRENLKRFYVAPVIDLGIEEYHSNRVTVLGRVLTPGVLQFDRPPLLLDVLSRAGSLPVLDKQATLTRCAVFRGREQIIWVDLKRLLTRGDLAYNIRLKPNDLIYIPDSFDTLVYVMGAVGKPGAYRLTPDMSLLDALSQAGGPNEDADEKEISIHRPSKNAVEKIPLAALTQSKIKVNFALEEGDVIYVQKKGIADVGYVMRQLMPGLSFLTFGMALSNASK